MIKPEQPLEVVTVKVTEYELAFPANTCVTLELPGDRIVTGGVPSPKSQTHLIIDSMYPGTTVD